MMAGGSYMEVGLGEGEPVYQHIHGGGTNGSGILSMSVCCRGVGP